MFQVQGLTYEIRVWTMCVYVYNTLAIKSSVESAHTPADAVLTNSFYVCQ